MKRRRCAAAIALAAGLPLGCALGPTYQRPALDVPASYREAHVEDGAQPLVADWWTLFEDPALTALEAEALAANQDLQVAIARVAEARATARIAASDFFPIITMDPSWDRERLSPNRPSVSSEPVGAAHLTDIVVPFDLTYEIDIWGRVRRSFESATAAARATESDARVVALTLAADVAQRYFAIRSLDVQSATLADSVDIYRDNLRLVDSRHRAGIVSELDVAQARTQLASTEARLADVRRQRAEAEHALAVLCGRPASDFSVPEQSLDQRPPEIPAGLPSQLLERRPDILAAEQDLVAANAEIGVAETLFFPQVRLTGAAGLESADFTDLLKWESRIWSIGPSVSVPVFEGGRLRANLKGAQARYAEAVASYKQTVLGAFRDVEDALVGVRRRAEQADAQAQAVTAAARAVFLARSQYEHGITDYLQVVIADAARLDLELQAAQTEEQRLVATVLLVKAIGGGWN